MEEIGRSKGIAAVGGKPGERSEREKMLAGDLYFGFDPELVALRGKAADLTQEYNSTLSREGEKRESLLRQLFGSLGKKPFITPPFQCDYGANIHAGNNLYMNFNCCVLDCNVVTFGDDVMLGPNVQIYAASHPLNPVLRRAGQELSKPVKIGSNVWIGGGAVICPGVEIGENSTIGAGSVVTKSVPANVVAAGNPAKIIRSLD